MDISIIIVSYNTRALTLACLRSIYAQTRRVAFEVLLVDNASSDGSAPAIAAEFPAVRLFALSQNLGFGPANNHAARHARGEWLLLLNPDTVILDLAIDKLVAFAERRQHKDPLAGIFGGRTLSGTGELDPTSAWGRPTLWSTFCMATGLTSLFRSSRYFNPEAMPEWERDTAREVDIVTGCFLLLRLALWNELGGFDSAFFMYGEEADLCLRARRRGVRCLIDPHATIIHYGGASAQLAADKLVRLLKARTQLMCRHWSPAAACCGVQLLRVWVLLHRLSAVLGSVRKYAEASPWPDAWRRRAEWIGPCGPPGEVSIVRSVP